MARNGSGDMSLLATFATEGQAPSATSHNAIMADIANEISNSINKDGTKPFAAAQSMGGFKLTSLGTATARTDTINLGQVQDGKANWIAAGGVADAITATYSPAITALVDGQECHVRAGAANATTTPTFAPNGLTARTIVKNAGAALVANDIAGAGHELILRYDLANTRWLLLNPAPSTSILGTANTFTAVQTIAIADAGTNTVTDILKLAHSTSGTAAASFGAGLLYQLEDAAGTLTDAASIDAVWVDATDATEDSRISFKTMVGGVAKAEAAYIAQGAVIGAPTGGDKGVGTINATAVYDDNVQILPLVIGAAQATTSGTSIDFTTGIPATTRRLTINLRAVSTSGTSDLLIQLGDAGGVETTGYVSTCSNQSGGSVADSTAGFIISTATLATDSFSGTITIETMGSNIWVSTGNLKASTALMRYSAGDKDLSATLDRFRITTVGGADTFDAGSANWTAQ